MSEEATFWFLIALIVLGAILIFNWIVPGIKIAAVGVIPFAGGIIALYFHHRRTCPPEAVEKDSHGEGD
jgi:hypothetical protein